MRLAISVALSIPLLASCVPLDPAPLPSAPPAEARECAIVGAALKAYAARNRGQEVFSTALAPDWIDPQTALPTTDKADFRDIAVCSEVTALAIAGEIKLRPIFRPVQITGGSGHRHVSMPAGTFVSRPFLGPYGSTEILIEPFCLPSWRVSMTSTGSEWTGLAVEDENAIVLCHERARGR